MSAKDGGPAFPGERVEPIQPQGATWDGPTHHPVTYPGMTLRDYFAGQMLFGVMADSGVATINRMAEKHGMAPQAVIAQLAYEMADAMLAEREK